MYGVEYIKEISYILINEYIALRKGTHSSQLTQSDIQPMYESLEKKDEDDLN